MKNYCLICMEGDKETNKAVFPPWLELHVDTYCRLDSEASNKYQLPESIDVSAGRQMIV